MESTALAFGHLAVERGLVEHIDIEAALKEQEKRRRKGTSARLGEILLELGCLTPEDVTEVYELQGTLGGHTEIEGYEIEELIGQGAMGRIFRARQVRMDRVVALKVLAPQFAQNKKYVKRFLREAQLAGKLKHENIVFVLDAGISNGVHYYVMEYVKGKTLKDILAERESLKEKELLRLALHMARALEHADDNGILHRDIKPSNIIISENRIPKLCDFGLAKDIMFDPRLTSVGTVMGTPLYISPEQIRGEANDIRSDIYSLGATLYHCACGDAPFMSSGSATVMVKHLTEDPKPLRDKRPDISEEAAAIIHKMLEKDPDDRFQTPVKLWKAIQPLVFDRLKPIEVEVEEIPDSPVKQKKTKARRRRRPRKK
jgi:serine/threonine-protein kinase